MSAWRLSASPQTAARRSHSPSGAGLDVALLDLNMPGVSGIGVRAAIRQSCPDTEVMILTVSEQEPDLYALLRSGPPATCWKDIAPAELIEAVLAAGRGEPRIAASMAGYAADLAGSARASTSRPARRAERARARACAARGVGSAQPRDRRTARNQRGHGEDARVRHRPREAAYQQSRRGRRLCCPSPRLSLRGRLQRGRTEGPQHARLDLLHREAEARGDLLGPSSRPAWRGPRRRGPAAA